MAKNELSPSSPRRDRTTLVVRLGLFLLFLLGVLTIFGDSLLAALFPGADTPTAPAAPPPAERSGG